MKSIIIKFITIALILSSCSDKPEPPLKGNRVNVLHYDLMKDTPTLKTNIVLDKQIPLSSWNFSDIGQFTGLPTNISLNKDLKLAQKISLPQNSSSQYSASLIANNIFYQYSKGTIYAYDLSAKKKLWYTDVVKPQEIRNILSGGMAYHDNVIYLSSGTRDFIAINSSNGKELWRFKNPNVVRHIPLIHNNSIYLSSTDNTLSCLNLEGKLIWRYDAPIYSLSVNRLYIATVFYEDKIVAVTTAGDLIVLNRHDGEELTQVNLATAGVIGDGSLAKGPISSPFLNKHHLYILTGESELVKIDLENPGISWRQNIPNAKSFWVADSTSYILTTDNQLLAIDNQAGKIIWVTNLIQKQDNKKLPIFYGPILAGDQLIINSANEFFTFSPIDGKLIAKYRNNLSSKRIPIAINEQLYFIGDRGHLEIWK
jgi:outer membrane protein assembly factor BamB